MINWKAINKKIRGTKMTEEAELELKHDKFLRDFEAKILDGKYTIEDGHLCIKTRRMEIPELFAHERLLRGAGYKGVDSGYTLTLLLTRCYFIVLPKEA